MSETVIVYLNGDFLPLDEAKVSVLDRGFIFGDGVYEVIPVYGNQPFRLEHHLQRLQDSLNAIQINNPLSTNEWKDIITHIIKQNKDGGSDQSIYLQITRGVARRDHSFPDDTPPTVFVMSTPLNPPEQTLLNSGIDAVTLPDIRWLNCHIKAISLLPNVLFRQQAIDAGATEAILLRDGMATEGAASNLFIVKNDVIITPAKSSKLLPGITRDLIVELAVSNGIQCEERDISETELRNADEIWISSSTKEVMPVVKLDDLEVANGKPGPIWSKMYQLYQACKASLRSAAAAD
ncbi:MAG: D-amino acid aminotransferase [Gammaproteobacteria bacterium]|nr:D-amino acid aminotransferase [Gammaproteobacteria bacterium]